MNSIEIKDCDGVGGKRVIANGNPAMFWLGVAVGVGVTLYVVNKLSNKETEAIASTATDVINIANILKVA